ncbi:MAG: DUF362 domain-containing protein [Bacteroidota bacterium]|nr:DUF362 domain-containing protein [Bacteroidota bacterium]
MMKSIVQFFRTGKWVKVQTKVPFIVAGIVSTGWFLIRVIPKPQRAAYPCMRAAAPVMSSFILWCLSVAGMLTTWRKAKASFLRSRYVYGGLFGLTFVLFGIIFLIQNSHKLSAMMVNSAVTPNAPIGTAKGIFPGRVVWVYNPEAAKWNGTGFYWAVGSNPQDQYNKSFTAGLNTLTGGNSDAESWNNLFKWFNATHNRIGKGYQTGDKIAIKINMNNSDASSANAGNVANANPQSCVACVQSLVNAGIPQAEIWIGDPSRAVTDNVYTALRTAFPDIHVVDYFGNNGRETTTTILNVFPNNDVYPNQSACFYNARYIVNMPLLKGHEGQAITFGSKNFYGINGLKPVWYNNDGKHPGLSALTNYMTNSNFGGKTILWVMDAMYPTRDVGGTPDKKWIEAPFNGRPASSFIMSLDGVAEESVSLDFFNQHYPDVITNNGGMSNAEGYMIAAAQANVGVHEHWNNNVDRKYSKNLRPQIVNGIELVDITVVNTGLNQPTNDRANNEVTFYRTPNGYLHFSIPDVMVMAKLKINLFSMSGKSLMSKVIDSCVSAVYVGNLPSGIYLYRLSYRNKEFCGKIEVSK